MTESKNGVRFLDLWSKTTTSPEEMESNAEKDTTTTSKEALGGTSGLPKKRTSWWPFMLSMAIAGPTFPN